MNPSLFQLLSQVRDGELAVDDALNQLREAQPREHRVLDRVLDVEATTQHGSYEELGFAKVDHARASRQGFPEVIFCLGKTPDQVAQIAARLHARGSSLLATRATPEMFASTRQLLPDAQYNPVSRLITLQQNDIAPLPGKVGVLAAGTSDLPVAEEAVGTLEIMGAQVERIYDVGVAGLHRLLSQLETIRACDALIVCAGMEGALPSVVGGLVDVPVVAVPTGVGYGASFGGLAALLGMLNSCANGVAVVNIDNGFGAAAFTASILRTRSHGNTQKIAE